MNFKRYHVSKNLLSEKYENRSINGVGAFTIDSNYDLWIGEVVAGQTYAISNMNYIYGFFTAKPLPNTGATYDGSRGYETSGAAVVTVPSGCTWIAVRVLHNADNAMCNAGSQPLPYEPYSSEVWHDAPHYIHNTSTDTITTLPADLYADGNNATVGLKGNMYQASGVSPDNPIMPQGTGDKTANLWTLYPNRTYRGVTFEFTDNRIKMNNTCTQEGNISDTINLKTGTYTITANANINISQNTHILQIYKANVVSETISLSDMISGKATFTIAEDTTDILIRIHIMNDVDYSGLEIQPMLNTGSIALPYEPYGYKIPISSGGVNLFDKDNADIVDLYPDATTREIKQSSNLSTWSIVLPVEPSTTYTFTMGEVTTAIRRRVGMCSDYPTKGAYCTSVDDTPEYDHPNLGNIFTTDADTRYVLIMYVSGAGRDVAIERANRVQVVKGNTALPYEPYNRATTNIYLGEVETTRRVKKFVLTGEETLTSGSVIGQIRTPLTGAIDSLGLCTHYILKTSYGGAFPYIRIRSNTLWFEISPDGYETKEEALTAFKSYLSAQYAAGTPVTLWYVLATPETAVVNEPLMKIGDYADTVSGITIPTTAGANTLSVDTTLQPSEVTVNYKGWHPVSAVHERESGQWD